MNRPDSQPVQDLIDPEAVDSRNVWTVPNVICLFRLVGSLGLVAIAFGGLRYWFIGTYVVLCLSDWVDGKYARWMKQRSPLGARLDSAADALLNTCLVIGVLILCWEVLQYELVLIGAAIVSYLATSLYGLWKFGRVPAYHSYAAKITQVFTMVAAISLVLDWSVWPIRFTAVAAVLTNLEAVAITYALDQWRADVLSLLHVWPGRKDIVD